MIRLPKVGAAGRASTGLNSNAKLRKAKHMHAFISAFFQDQDGAITVDFVVLTAAICVLGLVVVTTFSGGTTQLAFEISNSMERMQPGVEP